MEGGTACPCSCRYLGKGHTRTPREELVIGYSHIRKILKDRY